MRRLPGPLVRMSLYLVAVLVLASLPGCGGGGGSPTASVNPPAAPTPTPPPGLAFIDGITDEPLTPQSVTPAAAKVGDSLTVKLDGYMTREEKWTGSRIQLWPLAGARNAEQAIQYLVYDGKNARPLLKWVSMRNSAAIGTIAPQWADQQPQIKARLSGVFADVAHAGGPAFSWGAEGLSTAALTVRVDPGNEYLKPNYVACTVWWQDGSTITKTELIFAEPNYALDDNLSMHMMGYAIGLSDWAGVNAVMNPNWDQRSPTFQEFERNAIHMMYQHRNPGNKLPDRDPTFTTSAGVRSFEVRQERAGFRMKQ